jgi:muconolactone delta-isomerase
MPYLRRPSVACIPTLGYYTLQLARPREGWGDLQQVTARARQASRDLQGEGARVRFLRAIFVPEHDACFCLYQAGSVEQVRQAALRAEMPIESIAATNREGEKE